jgi:hypothetical protein
MLIQCTQHKYFIRSSGLFEVYILEFFNTIDDHLKLLKILNFMNGWDKPQGDRIVVRHLRDSDYQIFMGCVIRSFECTW